MITTIEMIIMQTLIMEQRVIGQWHHCAESVTVCYIR